MRLYTNSSFLHKTVNTNKSVLYKHYKIFKNRGYSTMSAFYSALSIANGNSWL